MATLQSCKTNIRNSDVPLRAGRCIPCQLPITVGHHGADGYPVCPKCWGPFVEDASCNIQEMAKERQRLIKRFQERLPGSIRRPAGIVLSSPYAYSHLTFVLVRLRQLNVSLPRQEAEVLVIPRNKQGETPKTFKQALAKLPRYDLHTENPNEKVLNRDACPICMDDFPEEYLPMPLPKAGEPLSSVLDEDGDNFMLDIDDWNRVLAKVEGQKKQPLRTSSPPTIPGGCQGKASVTNTKDFKDALNGKVVVMPCKHMFHDHSCLKPWLIKDRAHSCPLCRTKLPFGVSDTTQPLGRLILDISLQFMQHMQASGWKVDIDVPSFTAAYELALKNLTNRGGRGNGRLIAPLPNRARRTQAQLPQEMTSGSRWVRVQAEPQATSQP